MNLQWGLSPDNSVAPWAAWGARGINELDASNVNRRIGLLPDRQDMQIALPDTERDRGMNLRTALGRIVDGRVMPAANLAANAMVIPIGERAKLDTRGGDAKIGLEDVGVRADVRFAGGYVYLGVWIECDDLGWDTAVWSDRTRSWSAPPPPGTRVNARVNRFGPGTVLRRFVSSGYAGVVVLLDQDSEDRERRLGKAMPAHLFGSEIEPLPVLTAPAGGE